jgi:methylated-DNA-protein-cysteine methyltransferase-like protein
VYRLVRRIPRGKVLTYGQVAAMIGRPRAARAVGTALGALDGALLEIVPWQRVVNAGGRVSPRGGLWAEQQRELLEREGVRFDRSGTVDLGRFGWRLGGLDARGATSRPRARRSRAARRGRAFTV